MYDRTGAGAALRRVTFNTFGWWHPFKHMSQVMNVHFGRSIFAPLQHHFFPKASMKGFGWMKLKQVLIYQTRLRLAYDDEVKAQMAQALQSLGDKDDQVMTSYLLNLQDLCVIFLPQVHLSVDIHPLVRVTTFIPCDSMSSPSSHPSRACFPLC